MEGENRPLGCDNARSDGILGIVSAYVQNAGKTPTPLLDDIVVAGYDVVDLANCMDVIGDKRSGSLKRKVNSGQPLRKRRTDTDQPSLCRDDVLDNYAHTEGIYI